MIPENEDIECLAAAWVAREDRGLAPDEASRLADWLDRATANRLAYLRLKAGWQSTERLGALRTHARGKMAAPVSWRVLTSVAAIVTILAAGIGVYSYFHMPTPESYVTARKGERPVLRLADGTRIQLNSDTKVKTSLTQLNRVITLEKGEAYFEVVHDAKRPFVVYAGSRRITDLGTKFSVRRNGDDVRVVVTEGKVRVDILDTASPAAPVFASGGHIVVAKSDETLVAAISAKDMGDELVWRTGMLTFDQETLASAAEEFNRYNRRRIIVLGKARDIRIGGSFRADNIDVFAGLVRNALGLKVAQQEDKITISQ